jgi:hypothetical protein
MKLTLAQWAKPFNEMYYNGDFKLEGHTFFLGTYGSVDLFVFAEPKDTIAARTLSLSSLENYCSQNCCNERHLNRVSVAAAEQICTKVVMKTIAM